MIDDKHDVLELLGSLVITLIALGIRLFFIGLIIWFFVEAFR